MNFLDLAQQNAAANKDGTASAPTDVPASADAAPAAAGNLFGISSEQFALQKDLHEANKKIAQDRAATASAAPAKPAGPQVTAIGAGERRKDGSQVEKAVADGIYVLTFHGEFDETNVDREFERIEKFLGALPHKIAVFDFRDVQYVNSKTMGYIADWYQRFTDVSGEMVIAHGGAVLDSLEACGITQLVQVSADVAEGVATLRAKYPEHVKDGVSSSLAPETIAPAAAPEQATRLKSAAEMLGAAATAPAAQAPQAVPAAAQEPVPAQAVPAQAPEAAVTVPQEAPTPPAARVEQQAPVSSPSGIRDSDGKTFVFYEKTASAEAPVPAAPPAAPQVVTSAHAQSAVPEDLAPKFEDIVPGVLKKTEGITLESAREIVAMEEANAPEEPEVDLVAEFGGLLNKAPVPQKASSVPTPEAPAKSASKPAAVPAKKSAAPRARKGKRLFLAVAVLAAAGAAAFQFAGPAGVSDVLSSVTSYFGAQQEDPVLPDHKPAQVAPANVDQPVRPRPPRPRRPVAPSAPSEAPAPEAK